MKATFKKIYKWATTALVALILLCTVLLVAINVIGDTPSIFGYNFFYIVTGSMEPTIHVGDIILCKQTPPEKLTVGDIVTFNGESGELAGKVVTHRIQDIYTENGELYIVTKGDANNVSDPPIKASAVISVMKSKIPLLGKAVTVINTPLGFLLLIVSPLLLTLIKEIIELVRAFRPTKEEQVNDKSDKTDKPKKQSDGQAVSETE